MNKKAQQIVLSVVFSLFIFILVVTLFYDNLLINPKISERTHLLIERESQRASEVLLSEGYPFDWDCDNGFEDIRRMGLFTNHSLDSKKVSCLNSLMQLDDGYVKIKTFLGIVDDYMIILDTNSQTFVYAHPDLGINNPLSSEDFDTLLAYLDIAYLAKTTRIISGDGFTRLTVYIYRVVS